MGTESVQTGGVAVSLAGWRPADSRMSFGPFRRFALRDEAIDIRPRNCIKKFVNMTNKQFLWTHIDNPESYPMLIKF